MDSNVQMTDPTHETWTGPVIEFTEDESARLAAGLARLFSGAHPAHEFGEPRDPDVWYTFTSGIEFEPVIWTETAEWSGEL